MKKVIVIGTGYVGLPLAIMLAKRGYEVVGVDIKESIVKGINNGISHIKEEDLDKIFKEDIVRKNLTAKQKPCKGNIFVIAVPTPLKIGKKEADLSLVNDSILSIIPFLEKGNLIIIESTVPPLTCRKVIIPIIEKYTSKEVGDDIYLAHCPERILPGNILEEIVNNDRIIGGVNTKSSEIAANMYSSFVKGNLYITDDLTAELCKLVENTFRDVNIALANELSLVADKLGIDIKEVISLANKHPRVNVLNSGIGVGGHCIPLDPWFITGVDPQNTPLIQTAREVNDNMPNFIVEKIKIMLKKVESPKITIVGLTYKANTNDIRESPAIKVIDILLEEGFNIDSYDPLVDGKGYTSLSEITKEKDCLIILVKHDVIMDDLKVNFDKILNNLKQKMIITFPSDNFLPKFV